MEDTQNQGNLVIELNTISIKTQERILKILNSVKGALFEIN